MPLKLSQLPLNPFEDNIVFEPREAEPSVAGLNDGPLSTLTAQFARLEIEPLPRRQALHLPAQLVISAEPGYGKSHLIGRLFHQVARRATRIYLRPFQDPASSWRSILLKMVQELHRPDDPVRLATSPGELTQLDALAHGVLAHLLAGLIEKGKAQCDDPVAWARELRKNPLAAFGHGKEDHYLANWMRQGFATSLRKPFLGELLESGVTLTARPSAWLKVLFAYAYGNTVERAISLEWLKGEGMSDEEADLIGLEAPEIPVVEETAAARNMRARERVMDLLSLAGFYRPFVLCFDQTEMMTGNAEACAEFGRVVEQLVYHGLNYMLVVTANRDPWEQISKSTETAHHARFSVPIPLVGINQQQGDQLVRQRLGDCDIAPAEVARFFGNGWLAKQFESKPSESVRSFLRLCAIRCSELAGQSGTRPETTLEDCFQHYLHEVRSKAGRLDFDAQVLQWSVSPGCVGDALDGTVITPHRDQKGYFPVCWKSGGQLVFWSFEDSSNWKRWEAILREAEKQKKHAVQHGQKPRAAFLRTPEQPKIPGAGWNVLKPQFESTKDWFHVKVVAREDLEIVVAAYDLFANAVEGNIAFDQSTTLGFLRTKLTPWWKGLLQGSAPAPYPSPAIPPAGNELHEQICLILSSKLFLSIDQLIAALPIPKSREVVLTACQSITEIKIFSTAQATALKWKSSPSQSAS